MSLSSPRILLIDSYDSFTYNLAALCLKAIPNTHIHIIKNDQLSIQQLTSILPHFSFVVVGPGPGSPEVPEDIGVISQLWKVPEHSLVPVFGVCLGCRHGQISQIHHNGAGLFKGVGETHAVRYHSLHVVLKDNGDIEPLAWADDGTENGRVVMAIKHRNRPFWAVQYHPESTRTSEGGLQVLQNFWRATSQPWSNGTHSLVGPSWPQSTSMKPSQYDVTSVMTSVLHLPNLPVADMCELLGAKDESLPFVLLESAAQPGRFSIIGCVDHDSLKLSYTVGDDQVRLSRGAKHWPEPLGHDDVWSWLTAFMLPRKAIGGLSNVPFWGGLVGYLGYELGLETLQVLPIHRKVVLQTRHPDLNMVFVERSIVVDSHFGDVYIQTLKSNDNQWMEETARRLTLASTSLSATPPHEPPCALFSQPPVIHLPHELVYKSRIAKAKEYLFSGESYELCLTAHTRITVHPRRIPTSSSWELYKRLHRCNPAPYSGFLRLHPSILLSSSPERFLSFTRPPNSRCQLRPIKGTIRKAPGITREVAEQLLAGSKKEVAENLMIVDLIRHDLHSVVGERVSVKQFCRVEEYETVWQMVSVIEGAAPASSLDVDSQDVLGWEVLKRSLPPGSMTGAPKKRSVEILQTLEDNNRSIYSGVFGYLDAGGGGDWSVVIRSCFKYDDLSRGGAVDFPDPKVETWTVGAGGAITALSDPDAEWDEMIAKLQSVLRTFEAAAG
ncbi:para-aminobenzoate synthase [Multifurca ochricompacta]|uniref:aminodeoxychorismate synthase n=1 Tax=Multifurca ochricompacta TaxID=376703 RepID=A0AAD4QUA8_9AGAM|nr:para-aminobenzoate synthase [Multifurca ochricompacta]